MATDEPPKAEKGVDNEDSSAQTRVPTETQNLLKSKAHQGSSPRPANGDSVQNFRGSSIFRTGDYTFTAPLWSRLGEDHWSWEIGGICLSFGGILFICTFLMVQDDKPVPVWHYGLTLNTLISVLATISKAALIMVVAATLDQNKWLWYYGRSQRLQDISLFSDAGKGPSGALSLLLSRRGSGLMIWFGATITICAIGFEPFLQQAIIYPLKEVPSRDQAASMRILSEIPGGHNPDGSWFIWEPMQSGGQFNNSIKTGIYDGDSYPRTMPICPNGNCRWPRYHAIAFCSKCTDVTNLTEITMLGDSNRTNLSDTIYQLALDAAKNKTFQPSSKHPTSADFKISPPTGISTNAQIQIANWSGWIGPNGSAPDGTSFVVNGLDDPWTLITTKDTRNKTWSLNSYPSFGVTSGDDGSETSSMIGEGDWINITVAGIPSPMVALGHLSMGWVGDGTERRAVEVLECALTPCLQEYEAKVTNNTLFLDVLSTTYGTIILEPNYEGARWTATANGTTFYISDQQMTLSQMAWYANTFLIGNVTQHSDILCDISNFAETGGVSTNCDFWDQTESYGIDGSLSASSDTIQAIDEQGNFSQTLANVAGSLTDLNRRFYNTRVLGDVLVAEPFVHVRWVWLTLPLVLLLMTLITLSVTIYQTKRSRIAVWKSSVLPLLYHGPDLTTASDQSATTFTLNKVSLMEIDARRISAQLVKTDNGVWKLQQKPPCTYYQTPS